MFTTAETLILVKFRLIVKRLIFGLLLSSYNLGLAKLIINRASGNPGTVHGIVIHCMSGKPISSVVPGFTTLGSLNQIPCWFVLVFFMQRYVIVI